MRVIFTWLLKHNDSNIYADQVKFKQSSLYMYYEYIYFDRMSIFFFFLVKLRYFTKFLLYFLFLFLLSI